MIGMSGEEELNSEMSEHEMARFTLDYKGC